MKVNQRSEINFDQTQIGQFAFFAKNKVSLFVTSTYLIFQAFSQTQYLKQDLKLQIIIESIGDRAIVQEFGQIGEIGEAKGSQYFLPTYHESFALQVKTHGKDASLRKIRIHLRETNFDIFYEQSTSLKF